MNISCKNNENFGFTRRVKSSCDLEFELSEGEIYQISYPYIDEIVEEFYTICPRCGYIIPLDKSLLENYEKNMARSKSEEDNLLYIKNNILSEYTNIVERQNQERKTKVRKL